MKISTNAAKGEAVFKYKRGKKAHELSISLLGMDSTTISHLALHGLHEMLNSRVDPKASYQDIRNNKLSKPKDISLIVKAVAEVYEKTLKEAETFWNGLSPENKRILRKDTRIKMALLAMDKGVEVDIESLEK